MPFKRHLSPFNETDHCQTNYVKQDQLNRTVTTQVKIKALKRHDKAAGKNVFLANDELKIDNDTLIWDSISGEQAMLPFPGDTASVRE